MSWVGVHLGREAESHQRSSAPRRLLQRPMLVTQHHTSPASSHVLRLLLAKAWLLHLCLQTWHTPFNLSPLFCYTSFIQPPTCFHLPTSSTPALLSFTSHMCFAHYLHSALMTKEDGFKRGTLMVHFILCTLICQVNHSGIRQQSKITRISHRKLMLWLTRSNLQVPKMNRFRQK